MLSTVDEYLRYYKKFLIHSWDTLGPYEYVTILVTVGVIGWYLMRKGASL